MLAFLLGAAALAALPTSASAQGSDGGRTETSGGGNGDQAGEQSGGQTETPGGGDGGSGAEGGGQSSGQTETPGGGDGGSSSAEGGDESGGRTETPGGENSGDGGSGGEGGGQSGGQAETSGGGNGGDGGSGAEGGGQSGGQAETSGGEDGGAGGSGAEGGGESGGQVETSGGENGGAGDQGGGESGGQAETSGGGDGGDGGNGAEGGGQSSGQGGGESGGRTETPGGEDGGAGGSGAEGGGESGGQAETSGGGNGRAGGDGDGAGGGSGGQPSSTQPAEPERPPAPPPYFPVVAGGYTFTQNQDIGAEILPEAAGGAGGFRYSLSPALPEGLSFDPATRALTGAPAAGGQYSMTYTAVDADGARADWSFTIEILRAAEAQEQQPPDKPEEPRVERLRTSTAGETGLTVTWTAPDDNGSPIIEYNVQYRVEGAPTWTDFNSAIPGATTRVALPGLQPGTTYEAQVRASNDEGDGPWSESGTGSTEAEASNTPDNTPPVFNDLDNPDTPLSTATRQVAENAPAGRAHRGTAADLHRRRDRAYGDLDGPGDTGYQRVRSALPRAGRTGVERLRFIDRQFRNQRRYNGPEHRHNLRGAVARP